MKRMLLSLLIFSMIPMSTMTELKEAETVPVIIESKEEQSNIIEEKEEVPFIKGIPLSYDIQKYIWEESQKSKIDPYLVFAVIEQESGYNIKCISDDGQDYGLMQIRTVNHEWLNKAFKRPLDYLNPYDNISAGIYMLRRQLSAYESSGVNCVLMSYNLGDTGALKLWKKNIYSTVYSRKVVQRYDRIKQQGINYKYE